MKALLKFLMWLLIIFVVVLLAFYYWPAATTDLQYSYPAIPSSSDELEQYVADKEAKISDIKEGNHAKIVWANDSLKTKTEYVLVYLHGFSASHEEGGPTHTTIADRFGMNLYLSRLSGHGLKGSEGMRTMTAQSLMETALEAVAIGKKLGNKVILMGTSTGATLGLPIMANDPKLHAGIFYSPNIDLFNPKSDLLTQPGGLYIARTVLGADYYTFDPPAGAKKFWTTKYPVEATVELQTLMNSTMHEKTFKKIKQPMLLVSYYKNEEEQDQVVSVPAIRECYAQLGTEKDLKRYVELADVGGHAMCSPFFSKNVEATIDEAYAFLQEVVEIEVNYE